MLPLRGHRKSVRCVAWSPDGRFLASGGADQTVRVWERPTGNLVATLLGHNAYVLAVAFSPDGRTLASGGGWTSQDVSTGIAENYIRFWEVPGGRALDPAPWHGEDLIACLWYHPAGRTLAASSRSYGGGGSIQGGRAGLCKLGRKPAWNPLDYDSVHSLALSPGGEQLAIGTDRAVYVRPWSRKKHVVLPHRTRVWSLALTARAERLASAMGNDVNLWDLSSPACPTVLKGHTREVRSIAFSPDGRLLASGGLDSLVILWDVEAHRERVRFDWKLGPVYAVAFAPDGMTMAAAGDEGVVVFDVDGE